MREVEQSGCRKPMRDGCDTNKRVIGKSKIKAQDATGLVEGLMNGLWLTQRAGVNPAWIWANY